MEGCPSISGTERKNPPTFPVRNWEGRAARNDQHWYHTRSTDSGPDQAHKDVRSGGHTSRMVDSGVLRLFKKTPNCGRRRGTLGVIKRGRPGRQPSIRTDERHNQRSGKRDRPGPGS